MTILKKSMNMLLIGILLTAITFNFGILNYILPAIGFVLLLFGFRSLRYENNWLKGCFVIASIQTIYFFSLLILNTTIIPSTAPKIKTLFTFIGLVLNFIEYICFWCGLKAIIQKTEAPLNANSAFTLIIWFLATYFLVFFSYNAAVIAVLMIIWFIFIIRSLYKLSCELNDTGYEIKTAPVKLTNRCIIALLALFLTAGGICGYAFGGSYPMKWSARNSSENSNAAKAQLLKLGFPEYVLNDISDEDIKACDNALKVITSDTVNEKGVRAVCIAVQVPSDEFKRYIIFHHFLWTETPKFYGTEAIQLNTPENWIVSGDITGCVLYDKDNQTFVSDYYSVNQQNFSNMFFGNQTNTFASFSMPKNGDNYRCYTSYPIESLDDRYIINASACYVHQKSLMQYPVMTAAENRISNNPFKSDVFGTFWSQLLFYPNEDKLSQEDYTFENADGSPAPVVSPN